MTETVEIQAETSLLQTSSSDLSVTVEGKTIENLPLNGRNFVSLTRTIPGVTRGVGPGGGNIDGAGSLAWRASASFSANGQRPRDNNYILDGVDNNETWLQTVVIFPSVDALDEFKLQTSTYAAEFGRSMGGVVNLQIKSGNNEFHGSAFEFAAQRRARRQQLVQQPGRAGEARLQPAPVRLHDRRPDHQGQDLLLRRLPGVSHHAGPELPLHRAFRRSCARATSPRSAGPSTTPSRASPSRATSSPQSRWDPASANVLRDLIPAPNTDGQPQRDRPGAQQLPDHPEPGAAGQPVRREGRPQHEHEQPVLPSLQLPEDPPAASRDDAARGRRRDHVRQR